jgi:hypothetical protein
MNWFAGGTGKPSRPSALNTDGSVVLMDITSYVMAHSAEVKVLDRQMCVSQFLIEARACLYDIMASSSKVVFYADVRHTSSCMG